MRQKYTPVLLTVILALCSMLLNEYPNYDSPKCSFLTGPVSRYIGYCVFLHICAVTREDILLVSVATQLGLKMLLGKSDCNGKKKGKTKIN